MEVLMRAVGRQDWQPRPSWQPQPSWQFQPSWQPQPNWQPQPSAWQAKQRTTQASIMMPANKTLVIENRGRQQPCFRI
eukprot:363913-Chlamydomonas_euryale.AAC.3